MSTKFIITMVVSLLSASFVAQAQSSDQGQRFKNATPEQRQKFKAMTPEQRQKLKGMTPEQRQQFSNAH